MATFTKTLLSSGTNGKQIKVAAIATPGTTLHTAVSGTSSLDEVWLWAVNNDTVSRTVTFEFGGTTAIDDVSTTTLAPNSGMTLCIQGLLLQNSLLVKAYASAANVVCVNGYVNRIS